MSLMWLLTRLLATSYSGLVGVRDCQRQYRVLCVQWNLKIEDKLGPWKFSFIERLLFGSA